MRYTFQDRTGFRGWGRLTCAATGRLGGSGATGDEGGAQQDLLVLVSGARFIQQQVGGGAAELVLGLPDGGQRRGQVGGELDVVVSDHGGLPRDGGAAA